MDEVSSPRPTTKSHAIIGEGATTAVLLHGLLGSHRNLATLARRWSYEDARVRIVLPDLLGHGEAEPLPPDAALDVVAEAVFDVVDSIANARALWLVGHSLGGRVALAMAAMHPKRVVRLSLLDIAPGPVSARPMELVSVLDALLRAPGWARDRSAMRETLERAFGIGTDVVDWLLMNLVRRGDHHVWRIDRNAIAEFSRRVGEEDLWHAIERDDRAFPVDCIYGAKSEFVSALDVERFVRAHCRVVRVEDAGHFLHIEQAARVVEVLRGASSSPH